MSRYNPPDYRGPPRDRSRSPSRFSDRRPSATSVFDTRPPPPPRTASDAPRGPRSQFDAPRPPPPSRLESSTGPRPPYTSLRDAPPLGSGDRGRPYRERDDYRRDRPPSRERSPARGIKDARDYPPRDLDMSRARRESRDGPLSAGSNYSDSQPPTASQFRGGFGRGRARGDFAFRGGRGGRSNLDDRDLIRRDRLERSPPPRWGARDRSRDERDDRRFERREDERRPSDWAEREREREGDRLRRDPPPPRLDNRPSNESISSANASYQPSQAPPINPERLALLEKAGGDPIVRRSSVQIEPTSAREARREQPETPAYLNGRAETTAKRYESRDSSPPTQAPAVPAFSFLPPSAPPAPSAPTAQAKSPKESKRPASPSNVPQQSSSKPVEQSRPEPPADAPVAPKAQLASPPPAAPRAPRALDTEDAYMPVNRLQPSRSLEALSGQATIPTGPANTRVDPVAPSMRPPSLSPAATSALPTLIQPVSPRQAGKLSELGAPTGPRASRPSPRLASVSPRPPFASPRSDAGTIPTAPLGPRTQTPPPSAPSGPRSRAYSVSPKAAPTAPKASRVPPLAPRGPERGPPAAPGRAPDRLSATQPWAPPSAPRAFPQWNQWRKPGAPAWDTKSVPAKRDFAGEEKVSPDQVSVSILDNNSQKVKSEDGSRMAHDGPALSSEYHGEERTTDRQPPRRQTSLMSGQDHGHSAAQSFFGKPVSEGEDDDNDDTGVSDMGQEPPSTSEDDDSDIEDGNLMLFHAKFAREKRQLEAQMVDLSARPYRATTPLESIARLARISAQDLQRVTEQREHEMEVDNSPETTQVPLATHSSDSGESTELVTPRGETHHRVNIRGSDDSLESIRRLRRSSPEPVSLPYLVKDGRSLFHDSDAFRDVQKRHAETTTEVLDAMEDAIIGEEEQEGDMEAIFADVYRRWREECEDLDREREEQEKLERQRSIEPGPELDAPMAPPANPFEGRRLHKYSSEYDVEQVLKQSEETARIERERQEREAKKTQADMEKEAFVPDQLTEEEINRGVFVDYNRFRDPRALTVVFSYEPPVDDFTENEQQVFIAAFKETPKKWGEIASLLEGRTYEDCIRHYYANKWDGRFRDNRTKKLKAGGRRGRGGARGPRGRMGGLMADLARAEDFLNPENMSEKGRPRRAAAPTTFAEKEAEAKASLQGPSPNKKPGPVSKGDTNGDTGSDKPGKRQKRAGGADKPGRKPKGGQPLQNLVSAPHGTFGKDYLQNMGMKADPGRAQKLEEAGLLAGLHAGHHGITDGQVFYTHDGMTHPMPGIEDTNRAKAGTQAPAPRQSASSYWSVPEQTDFFKYIEHFGRDFAAIASHMGTKTQTMIKNHFQRQIDSGSRPDMEEAANIADERRARGEELGPPPTPTPIVKRKYENPQAPPSRSLAPHAETMEVDDHAQSARAQPKHASPPQFQSRPQFTTAPHSAQTPAARVVPSPLAAAAIPASTQIQAARPHPHTLGPRPPFLSETRPDSRQGLQPDTGFRAAQESPRRIQPPQAERTHIDARDPDPQYLRNLVQEQERALLMQRQYSHDRMEIPQRQNSANRNPAHGSPLNRPLHHPVERKPLIEERPLSPHRNAFPGFPPRPSLGSSTFGPTPFTTTFVGRSPFNPSPTKREEHRPGSVPTGLSAQSSTTAPHAEPPKRSNVLSLLNSEEEEPKPPKRESLPSAPQRQPSPITQTYPHSTSAPSIPGVRREPSFGQPSIPQSRFQGTPFGSQSSAPSPGHSSLKHEPGNAPVSQAPPQDWAAVARLSQTSQPPSATPTLERDVRQYYSHSHRSSLLGGLNQARMVPSPPPLGSGIGHSRTPSLSAQTTQPGREQPRSSLAGPQQSARHQPAQPLQPNPYASQQPTPFSQQARETQNQAQHSHNSSLGSGPFPSFHHRGMSRDDAFRHEQTVREREREREEQDLRWRRQELQEMERRREEEVFRQRQQEQERQQRAPPPPLQPQHFGGPPFGQSRGLDLRAQARIDTEAAIREEENRQRVEQDERHRRDVLAAREREHEEYRRRQEDAFRRTPLGGGFGIPPPQRR